MRRVIIYLPPPRSGREPSGHSECVAFVAIAVAAPAGYADGGAHRERGRAQVKLKTFLWEVGAARGGWME